MILGWYDWLFITILFGLILPFISQGIAVAKVLRAREIMDNFTLLYTYIKYPIYWFIGVLQFSFSAKKI